MAFTSTNRYADITLTLLRVVAGLLFMQHGAQKLFGLLGGMGAPGQSAELISQMGVAGVLEFFGGLAIVLGLQTRLVALILLLEMLVAYFTVHLPQGFFPIMNSGELPILYGLIWLFLAGNGGGRFSLDARLGWGGEPRPEAFPPKPAERAVS